jgi:putative membrane protein insertion efficiency factor
MQILSDFYIGLVKLYRLLLVPIFVGLGAQCRFTPTCSHFSEQAVRELGLFRGIWISLKRVLRCHPFCQGGHDPVPNRKTGKF